jgi:hypothetical protein
LLHFGQQPGFWTELLDRARELSLQVPLSHGLTHVARLFSTSAPPTLSARLRSLDGSLIKRPLMTAMLRIALRPENPGGEGPLGGFVRWLLYVRSHWLRMPPHLLIYHLGRKMLMRLQPDRKVEPR